MCYVNCPRRRLGHRDSSLASLSMTPTSGGPHMATLISGRPLLISSGATSTCQLRQCPWTGGGRVGESSTLSGGHLHCPSQCTETDTLSERWAALSTLLTRTVSIRKRAVEWRDWSGEVWMSIKSSFRRTAKYPKTCTRTWRGRGLTQSATRDQWA